MKALHIRRGMTVLELAVVVVILLIVGIAIIAMTVISSMRVNAELIPGWRGTHEIMGSCTMNSPESLGNTART